MTKITCDRHGISEAVYVCCHLPASLSTQTAIGFNWLKDEQGEFQAFCHACWELTEEEWALQPDNAPKLLCLGCFSELAKLNNVRLGEQ